MPQDSSHPLQSRFRRYQQQRHGRQQDRLPCVLCGAQLALGLEPYTEHFRAAHGDVLESELAADGDATAVARKYYRRSQNPPDAGQKPDEAPPTSPRRANKTSIMATRASADTPTPTTPASPSASGVSSTRAVLARGTSPSSQGNTTHRSRARLTASVSDVSDLVRSQHPSRNPRPENTKRGTRSSGPRLVQHQQPAQSGSKRNDEVEGSVNSMLRQPETRPISQQQLVAEVKGIYKGLVLVESKCIEVDAAQSAHKEGDSGTELSDEQWQALGALHRALLHEHHDFFLASQHPYATPPLKRLASKYSMPARMWRHGIHSYLELLRHRLPNSREHMLSYVYLAYDMMALLYETIPSYEETWIECLGDLGRYRMAIEDDNMHDREIWTEVSRHWYKRASDLSPGTGRLYHHLAILARPNWLQQLFYYSKSLCVPNPFESARESILTLFEPLVMEESGAHPYEMQQQPIDPPFVRCHACMFMRTGAEQQRLYAQKFLSLLDNHIARTSRLFLQPAYTIGIANCCAMVEYGSKSNVIFQVLDSEPDNVDQIAEDGSEEAGDAVSARSKNNQPTDEFIQARALTCDTARLILDRLGDPNVYPFVHVTLVFIYHLTFFHAKGGMAHVERAFPWSSLVDLLNTLRSPSGADPKHESDAFPGLVEDRPPLPEDFSMRGLLWADKYHPDGWLAHAKVDDEEKGFELPSMAEQRRDRILWLGCRIAKYERWIRYDSETRAFSVVPEFAGVEAARDGGGGMDVDSSGSDATVGAR